MVQEEIKNGVKKVNGDRKALESRQIALYKKKNEMRKKVFLFFFRLFVCFVWYRSGV